MRRELQREQRILRKTYHDVLDAFRFTMAEDPETGESRMKEEQVYSSVPCALSVSSKSGPERGTITDSTSNENVIFADPDIQMLENDHVIVRTESGQTYDGRSGKTYVTGSPGETTIKVERMV